MCNNNGQYPKVTSYKTVLAPAHVTVTHAFPPQFPTSEDMCGPPLLSLIKLLIR